MAEFRRDAAAHRSVIFAENRTARPNMFLGDVARCPFCRGHEADTPATIAVYAHGERQGDDAADWSVRIVPNKFPAVDSIVETPITPASNASGLHEVIVEGANHLRSFSEVSDEDAATAFLAYRDRLVAASETQGIAYAQLFKNVGPAAGASIEHLHSQLLAIASVPDVIRQETEAARNHHEGHDRLWHEDLITDAESRESVVLRTDTMIAFCPRVPRFAFETWIMPLTHQPAFECTEIELLREASLMTREVVQRLELCHPSVAYNWYLHSAPFDQATYDSYQWHLELIPRLGTAAGFEWATGWHLNTVTPETAARHLRDALV